MKYLDSIELTSAQDALCSLELGGTRINARIEAYSCKLAGQDKRFCKSLELEFLEREKEKQKNSPSPMPLSHSGNGSHGTGWSGMGSPTSLASQKLNPSALVVPEEPLNGSRPLEANMPISNLSSSVISRSLSNTSAATLDIDMTMPATRRMIWNLISTINQAYPDYDFSSSALELLRKEEDASKTIEMIDGYLQLAYASSQGPFSFRNHLWKTIDDMITLKDCQVFSFNCDEVEDEISYINDDDEHNGMEVEDQSPFDPHGKLWSFNIFFYNKSLNRVLYFSAFSSINLGDKGMDMEDFEDAFSDSVHSETMFGME
eukprot:CAMPEP_0184695442 /NCGR_PEP_ID=MMETSP0313-20130426/3062_1 /TAXON_ID=2792 /ORGANISM="Porphyridium aerugineum, Strain SAG 1380-2" /LENGTH=316 /DNA_ID=CAMNT_0027153893 /DNA_START=113 /DNA_END=1063 /DNA_ORIENTATION=+